MSASDIFLDDIVIAVAGDPTAVIQVDANSKLEIWKLLEQSDRQRFALSQTDIGFWTVSSVTGGARIATNGQGRQLVISSSSKSETEWSLEFEGELDYGIPIKFKSRTPANHYMTVHGNYDGTGEIRATPPAGAGQVWKLVKPKTR
jgi:hypothetical protein